MSTAAGSRWSPKRWEAGLPVGGAREAAELIRDVRSATARAVERMNRGTAEAEAGSELAAGAGGVLDEILSAVERTAGDVGAITRAADEIARSGGAPLAGS